MSELPVALVIDLGLTNCKALAVAFDGTILEQAVVPYPTYHPLPGFVEQDPQDWWKAVCTVTRQVVPERSELIPRLSVLSVTAHMHALVALDHDNQPLHRAIVLGDHRSLPSAGEITAELGLQSIYRITGARMEASMPAAKMHWFSTQSHEFMESVHLFTGCKDYLRGRLTGGDRWTDPVDACAMSLYDLRSADWAPDLLRIVGISADRLPEIRAATDIAGGLCAEAARALNLPEGIPVVVGSGDDVEVLGAGLLTPGGSFEHLGTTGSFLTCSASLAYDPGMALEVYPHVQPGLWVVGGSITSAGAALAWAAEMLGFENRSEILPADAGELAVLGEDLPLFLPHLLGERCPSWNPLVRGSWVGLSRNHNRTDLMRAAVVGTTFALKAIVDRIDHLVGNLDDVRVAQRGDEAEGWLQLRANVYGRHLGVLRAPEPTALGAMVLGAVGIGYYPDLAAAVTNLPGIARRIQPQPGAKTWVARQNALYAQVQERLLPVWEAMAQAHPVTVEKQGSAS